MMRHELREYPLSWRKNAAAYRLARTMYDTRCEAFGQMPKDYDALPYELRKQLMETAVAVLDTLNPARVPLKTPMRLVHPDDPRPA